MVLGSVDPGRDLGTRVKQLFLRLLCSLCVRVARFRHLATYPSPSLLTHTSHDAVGSVGQEHLVAMRESKKVGDPRPF